VRIPGGAKIIPGGAPLPADMTFKGDGNWDDQAYGRASGGDGAPAAASYCCYPDCAWLVSKRDVCCHAHAALVGHARVREITRIEDDFDREMAVDLLMQDMVEAADRKMFG